MIRCVGTPALAGTAYAAVPPGRADALGVESEECLVAGGDVGLVEDDLGAAGRGYRHDRGQGVQLPAIEVAGLRVPFDGDLAQAVTEPVDAVQGGEGVVDGGESARIAISASWSTPKAMSWLSVRSGPVR